MEGLGDDDHPQYAALDLDRTITGRWTFDPADVRPPFYLGLNAQGQLVTGLNADKLDGYHATDFAVASHTHVAADLPATIAYENEVNTFNLQQIIRPDANSTPVQIKNYTNAALSSTRDGDWVGNTFFLCSLTTDRLHAIDVSNPANPILIASLTDATNLNGASGIKIVGDYAYVACYDGDRLTIVDIRDPNAMTVVGTVTDATNINGPVKVSIVGKYAILSCYDGNSLSVIDISDPTAPTYVTKFTDANLSGPYGQRVNGKYLYVCSLLGNYTQIWDCSNPASMTKVGQYSHGSLHYPADLEVSGKYLFVVEYGYNMVTVLDISTPATPTLAGSVQNSAYLGGPYAVSYANGYLYTAGRTSARVCITDVTNPTAPAVVATYQDLDIGASNPRWGCLHGGYYYMSGAADFSIYRVHGLNVPMADIGYVRSNTMQVDRDLNVNEAIYARRLQAHRSYIDNAVSGTLEIAGRDTTDVTFKLVAPPSASANILEYYGQNGVPIHVLYPNGGGVGEHWMYFQDNIRYRYYLRVFHSTGFMSPQFHWSRGDGTWNAPTATPADGRLGILVVNGYYDSSGTERQVAYLEVKNASSSAAYSSTSSPAMFLFYTTEVASTPAKNVMIDEFGNLALLGSGASVAIPSSSKHNLILKNGTAPTAGVADGVCLYSEDVAASAELKVMDEASNITTLSPHNFTLFEPDPSYEFPWSYYSKNRYLGKEINADIYGALKDLETLTGKQYVYVRDLPANERRNWAADQAEKAQKRAQERAIVQAKLSGGDDIGDTVPPVYTPKQPPKWLANRIGGPPQ